MEMVHFSHSHPLLLVEDIEKNYYSCRGCKELIHDSSYKCARGCKFYLHKVCANLPKETNHPFHLQHPLILHDKVPYRFSRVICNSCRGKRGNEDGFFYHCSFCKFDLCMKCTLLSNLFVGDFPRLHHFSHQHPLLFLEKHYIEDANLSCHACEKPISYPAYCCFDCAFFLHKKCADLPLKINHPGHRKHPLILSANHPPHKQHSKGFIYSCSPCQFNAHIKYTLCDFTFEATTHEHPFTLIPRHMSFICDACGNEHKDCMPCICTVCKLMVHEDCLSLPCAIKLKRHEHSLSHIYFFQEDEVRERKCNICYNEVNMEYGSYHCLTCSYFVHVSCGTDKRLWDKDIQIQWLLEHVSSFNVLKDIKIGDDVIAVEIKHFSHDHKLILREEMEAHEEFHCDGCMGSISTAFYSCVECEFFLHKSCAELPRKKKHWNYLEIQTLEYYSIFRCNYCRSFCSGFAYVSDLLSSGPTTMCTRCNEIPDYVTSLRHEHPLIYDYKELHNCSTCNERYGRYKCNICDFVLCRRCMTLPSIAWSKHYLYEADKHPLALTYRDDIHDPDQCYCDICEEPRDRNAWFYYCSSCDHSFHVDCALGECLYVKLWSPVKLENHEHPLVFVREDFVHHMCHECNNYCKNVFLKCIESECKYVVHFTCLLSSPGETYVRVASKFETRRREGPSKCTITEIDE